MLDGDADFSFVSEARVREVVEAYYREAIRAYDAGCYLGTLVACGGVVEGVLTWALGARESKVRVSSKAQRDNKGTIVPIEKWNLTALILVATELKVIGRTAEQASWAVKEFRNFIHPYAVLGQSARADASLAMSAIGAVREIARSLSGRLTG